MKVCAFSGHRPHKFPWKYNESDPQCLALKAALTEQIVRLSETGVSDWLSGMAEGTDFWAAEAILTLRENNPAAKLHCILPCREQPDKWSEDAKNRYFSILRQADSVIYVSRNYYKDCMLDRNRFMVDHASILLAVYNGEKRGGTAATVNYAKKMKREIIAIDPFSHEAVHLFNP